MYIPFFLIKMFEEKCLEMNEFEKTKKGFVPKLPRSVANLKKQKLQVGRLCVAHCNSGMIRHDQETTKNYAR